MCKQERNVILFLIISLFTSCLAQGLTDESFPESGVDTSDHTSFIERNAPISIISTDIEEEKTLIAKGNDLDIKNYCKKFLEFAFREYEKITVLLNDKENKYECNISLMNICGDDIPEMILSLRSGNDNVSEYVLGMNESTVPVCMGTYTPSTKSDGLYFDLLNNTYYMMNCGCHPAKKDLDWITVKKLGFPLESTVSPDFAEYKNDDELSFMENTHLYIIRYDDEEWNKPEDGAAIFYCEDSGLYEAYSVSKQILDLTSIEIGDFANADGNRIYSYLPGENYLVSRREYEQIMSKTFEILTEVTDEPEISSGWIHIDDADKWIDSLA